MGATDTSAKEDDHVKDGDKASSGDNKHEQSGSTEAGETFFEKFKSGVSSPKVAMMFQKLKEAKVIDIAKKAYDVVKDELSGNPTKRKHLEHTPSPSWTGEKSTRTDLVVTQEKQSIWGKVKNKVNTSSFWYFVANRQRFCIFCFLLLLLAVFG